MGKRFTDTEKWRRPWFRNLPMEYRELWSYILDTCDFIGVWYVDMGLATYSISHELSEKTAIQLFSKQIKVLDSTRWFVKDFVEFQYGALVPNNNMHRSVISKLKALSLLGADQPLTSPSSGAKDKEKEKDKVKDKVKPLRPTFEQVRTYCEDRGNSVDPNRWYAHYESNGWKVGMSKTPMVSWKAAVHTWEDKNFDPKKKELPKCRECGNRVKGRDQYGRCSLCRKKFKEAICA